MKTYAKSVKRWLSILLCCMLLLLPLGMTAGAVQEEGLAHGALDITQGKTTIAATIHWSPLHQVQFSAAGGIIAMATTS